MVARTKFHQQRKNVRRENEGIILLIKEDYKTKKTYAGKERAYKAENNTKRKS